MIESSIIYCLLHLAISRVVYFCYSLGTKESPDFLVFASSVLLQSSKSQASRDWDFCWLKALLDSVTCSLLANPLLVSREAVRMYCVRY